MSIIPSFLGRRPSSSSSSGAFDPFSFDVWDPFRDDFPFFAPSAMCPGFSNSGVASFARAAHVDWKETPEAHVFKADLPGLGKAEVKVQVEDGKVLQISGERTREEEQKTDTWHRVERSSGKFLRRFRLPEDAKAEEVKAAMENGVLTVTVPKGNVKRPSLRAVEISD